MIYLLVVLSALAGLGGGFFLGKYYWFPLGFTRGGASAEEELAKLRTILDAAGLQIDQRAVSDLEDETSGSWTGIPIPDRFKYPQGTIPKWDEVGRRPPR